MGVINKTSAFTCQFLNEDHFAELHKTFIEAFSDYATPFQHTEDQFQKHLLLNAVDLEQTVGCFVEEKMVGFTLNGFGSWNGSSTVYDAGTGVIPAFRRQGISRAMFAFMFPIFKARGVEQCLLEVITSNEKAVNLYRSLNFRENRKLMILKAENPLKFTRPFSENVEIRRISEPDWDLFVTFWDGQTSWQNSVDAIKRSVVNRKIFGAFSADRCTGYIIFSLESGRLSQMAVDKNKRKQGIGSLLLAEMQAETKEGNSLQVINLDESLTSALGFFQNRGFEESFSQYEMISSL